MSRAGNAAFIELVKLFPQISLAALPDRCELLIRPSPVNGRITAGVRVNTFGSRDKGLGVVGVFPMLAFNTIDKQIGYLRVGIHQVPQLHCLLRMRGTERNDERIAVGNIGIFVGLDHLHEYDFFTVGLIVFQLLAGFPVLEHGKTIAGEQVVLCSCGGIRHDQAFLIPFVHHFTEVTIAVRSIIIHDCGAVIKSILQNTHVIAQGINRQSFLHTAGAPCRNQRIHIRISFMNLSQDFVHIIVGAHFRNFNAQRIHDVLTHGETGRTGSILHVGEGIEYAAEPTGIQIHRIDYSESTLSIFFNKVIQRCCIVIADNSSQLAGNIIVIQKVDRLAGGERQIDLFCILTANQFDFNPDFLPGDFADGSGNFFTIFCIGSADTPDNKLYNITCILSAAGIAGTFVFRGRVCII